MANALKGRLAAVIVMALVASACSFFVPSSERKITVGGIERTYKLYVPPNLPPEAPLVIMLHAAGANTIEAEQTSAGTGRPRSASSSSPIRKESARRGTPSAAAEKRWLTMSTTSRSSPR